MNNRDNQKTQVGVQFMKVHGLTLDGKPRFVEIEPESEIDKNDENFLRQRT